MGEPPTGYALHYFVESVSILRLARVESKRFLIEVAEQVERFYRDVRALEPALEQAPEVLAPVGMDLAVNVRLSVVDDLMHVICAQPVVGLQCIRVDGRARRDVLADVDL